MSWSNGHIPPGDVAALELGVGKSVKHPRDAVGFPLDRVVVEAVGQVDASRVGGADPGRGPARQVKPSVTGQVYRAVDGRRQRPDVLHHVDLAARRPPDLRHVGAQHPE